MDEIFGADPDLRPIDQPPYKRLGDDELAKIGQYQIPSEHPPFAFADFLKRQQFIKDLNQFFTDEKVLAVVDHSRGTDGGGTVFVQSGGSYKIGETTTVPQVAMATEHWTRIERLMKQKKDVTLELNVANTFYDDDPMQYNTVAEIPGSDKKDEIVMLGAHVSSQGGVAAAPQRGAALRADVIQLFTKTPNQWREPVIAPAVIERHLDGEADKQEQKHHDLKRRREECLFHACFHRGGRGRNAFAAAPGGWAGNGKA